MPKPSTRSQVSSLQQQIADLTRLSRLFRSELRKLRSLASPNLTKHWWMDALQVQYKAKVLDMRSAEKWLNKFALIVPLESITSEDSDTSGSRTFTATFEKSGKKLFLSLELEPFSAEENPQTRCRKVQVGVDTHTYTSTTPRYQLICED